MIEEEHDELILILHNIMNSYTLEELYHMSDNITLAYDFFEDLYEITYDFTYDKRLFTSRILHLFEHIQSEVY